MIYIYFFTDIKSERDIDILIHIHADHAATGSSHAFAKADFGSLLFSGRRDHGKAHSEEGGAR